MRNSKKLGLIAVAVLALSGLGAGSASAHRLEVFGAGKVTSSQEGSSFLTTAKWGAVNCNTSLSGEIASTTKTAKLALSGTCTAFGIPGEFKMNGCSAELTPGMDGFGFGPSGCGPITVQLYNCTISIPSQNGLYATYENTGSGVRVSLNSERLRYSGCGSADNESGKFSATWNLKGTQLALPSEENVFDAEYFPATISGSQVVGAQHVIGTEGGAVSCATASFSGSLAAASHTLALTPTLGECQAFGFVSATVALNGCKYVYVTEEGPGENFPLELDCPLSNTITVTAATCSISIPQQTVKGVDWANATPTSPTTRSTIENTLHVSGLAYTVTKDGIGCPFKGTGSRTDGTYTGETLFSGSNPEGRPLNLDIGI